MALSKIMASMLSSVLVLGGFIGIGLAGPEQGQWNFDVAADDVNKNVKTFFFYKSMFNQSHIGLTIFCEGSELVPLTVQWIVRQSPCANEYIDTTEPSAKMYLNTNWKPQEVMPYNHVYYVKREFSINCSKDYHQTIETVISNSPDILNYEVPAPVKISEGDKQDEAKQKPDQHSSAQDSEKPAKKKPAKKTASDEDAEPEAEKREKRAVDAEAVSKEWKPATAATYKQNEQKNKLVRVWDDGYYIFVLQFIAPKPPAQDDFEMHVKVTMSYGTSYLSAVEWPLLIFYGVMGLVYIFFGLFWLVMLACNWRDLLRVQFWIGAVIFLGMLEKAVFFGEFENINKTGQSVRGAIIVAELVSCLKRTLARMLVLIVSLGYGIVKPRLGQTFHKVVFVGVVFFVLASIESCTRALSDRADQSVKLLVASVPLAVTDAIICWWIFSSLLQTTRTLRLRRNVVKLSLYRHFTNTLIFSVIASVAYMIWFMTQHRLKECVTDWRELWIDDAFWHLLFSVILFVIMILWRPSVNNQR
jgi:hypothetical protein